MNFIVYEDEKDYAKRYKNVINKLLMGTNLNYEITEINEYNDETEKQIENEHLQIEKKQNETIEKSKKNLWK